MGSPSQGAEERKRFFEDLYSLDKNDSDSSTATDVSEEAPRPAKRRRILKPHQDELPTLQVPKLARAQTLPSPQKRAHAPKLSKQVTVPEVQPPKALRKEAPTRRPTKSAMPAPSKGKTKMPAKKKLKKGELPEIPEAQRILKGMVFYFVPNNDINPARKNRIKKAEQYGAVRALTFDEDVTHVITDRDITYQGLLKHFKADELPSTAAHVNENYPAECIGFRTVIDTGCSRFRLDGDERGRKPSGSKIPNGTDDADKLLQPREQSVSPLSPFEMSNRDQTAESPSPAASKSDPQIKLSRTECDTDDKVQKRAISQYQDELSKVMQEMKGTIDLPLDPEEESRPGSSSSATSEPSFPAAEDAGSPMAVKKTKQPKGPGDFSAFSCMHKSDGKGAENNPNARTMEVLQQMATYYDNTGDHWRTRAYRKAISELRRQPDKITTKEQAIQLPGVGERLADKIEEIVWTDTLKRLESTSLDPNAKVLALFMGVYQVGYAQASKWIAQGHRTLEDLKINAELSPNQLIGIEHYEDFKQRIPRTEVAKHGDIVRKEACKVDADIQVTIGGSYRRGSSDSGDIDLLITKEGASASQLKDIMSLVVARLHRSNFLVAGLATGHGKASGSKWHGASFLPGSKVWRRIDLLYVPWEELGAALIYFTGNDIFNRSMRLLASRKNMRLNQHGLYKDVLRGPQRTKLTEGTLLEGHDERKIFRILGVPYRPPEHRIC